MRDRIGESFKFAVGGFQIGGAVLYPLLQPGVEVANFLLRSFPALDVLNDRDEIFRLSGWRPDGYPLPKEPSEPTVRKIDAAEQAAAWNPYLWSTRKTTTP